MKKKFDENKAGKRYPKAKPKTGKRKVRQILIEDQRTFGGRWQE